MNMDTLINQKLKIIVKQVEPIQVKEFGQSNAITLPKWLTTEVKPHVETQQNRIFFAAAINNEDVGIMAVQLTKTGNAHIDWMVINEKNVFQAIGLKLLLTAEDYCYAQGYSSITAETEHSQKNDDSYFNLYSQAGYKSLFELGEANKTTYLQKSISLNDFEFIDLTHTLTTEMPHWGLDVGFKYNARFIQGTDTTAIKFRVQRLEMSAGIGTHMDAPAHCFEKGLAIDTIPLQSLITICRVIDVSAKVKTNEKYSITPDDISHFENEYGVIPDGAFVILYTGWSHRWSQPEKYRNEKIFPNISVDAANVLLSRNIVGIGIDTLSPDAYGSDFPVHSLILGAGKYMIENVAHADKLDPIGNYIFALPIKIADGTEAPMRLIGMKRKRFS